MTLTSSTRNKWSRENSTLSVLARAAYTSFGVLPPYRIKKKRNEATSKQFHFVKEEQHSYKQIIRKKRRKETRKPKGTAAPRRNRGYYMIHEESHRPLYEQVGSICANYSPFQGRHGARTGRRSSDEAPAIPPRHLRKLRGLRALRQRSICFDQFSMTIKRFINRRFSGNPASTTCGNQFPSCCRRYDFLPHFWMRTPYLHVITLSGGYVLAEFRRNCHRK